jgi:hypothetical protein
MSIGGTFSGANTTCAQAACGTTCYTAPELNILIPDGGMPTNGTAGPDAIATLNITEHGTIQTLTAKLHITHSWQGDVRARLVHPDGLTSLDLVNRPGVTPPKQGHPQRWASRSPTSGRRPRTCGSPRDPPTWFTTARRARPARHRPG